MRSILFPSYIQHDKMDCGPACLKIISKFYQKNFSLKFLRDRCYITREGVSLFDIGRAAEDIGYRTLAIKVQFSDLQTKMPLPVIVHWQQRHFVVVHKVTRKKVFVSDPANGLINYTHAEFCEAWETHNGTGAVLVMETTPEFYGQEDNETKASLRHFVKYLKPYHKYLDRKSVV